jgi:hypothetical protein
VRLFAPISISAVPTTASAVLAGAAGAQLAADADRARRRDVDRDARRVPTTMRSICSGVSMRPAARTR